MAVCWVADGNLTCAGGTAAEDVSVRGERIVKDSMRLGVPLRHSQRSALLEMDEDLADGG